MVRAIFKIIEVVKNAHNSKIFHLDSIFIRRLIPLGFVILRTSFPFQKAPNFLLNLERDIFIQAVELGREFL